MKMRSRKILMCSTVVLVQLNCGLSAGGEELRSGFAQPSIATDYCVSFADRAAELRAQNQKEELQKLKSEIEEKVLVLRDRTAALQSIIAKRDEMIKLASGELLAIYARMEAEPAAQQLEKINVETAASVLRRLKPQLAGEILAAMDVKRAAQLVQIIAVQDANIDVDKKS